MSEEEAHTLREQLAHLERKATSAEVRAILAEKASATLRTEVDEEKRNAQQLQSKVGIWLHVVAMCS